MFLSSCSTYEADLYPCDFNKYKCSITKSSGNNNLYESSISFSASKGLPFFGSKQKGKQDETLILTVGTTYGAIFPPHLGRHCLFSWDWPPKTATILATDSATGEKIFEINYSRYIISMDSDGYYDCMQGAVEYCINELKNSPPENTPRKQLFRLPAYPPPEPAFTVTITLPHPKTPKRKKQITRNDGQEFAVESSPHE
ncbi:MAG: hypothetical protein WC637_08540 [Victivallales bacterium]|jgi:hypothetical protein